VTPRDVWPGPRLGVAASASGGPPDVLHHIRSGGGIALWCHEARRCGPAALGLPALAAAGIVVASLALHTAHAGSPEVVGATMVRAVADLFPLTAGLAAAAVVGRECLTEIQLSVPTPYRVTLGRRVGVLGAVVLGAAAVCVAVLGTDHQWLDPAHGLAALLVPAAPALLLIGAATWAGVALRSAAGASTVVLGAWLAQLLIADRFLGPWQVRAPVLALAGVGLAALAWRRLGDSEALLSGDGE